MNEERPLDRFPLRHNAAMLESMREFAEIDRRIARLGSHASREHGDAWLLADTRDVLALGYAAALEADARRYRLEEQVDRLLEHLNHPHGVDQVRRLIHERRAIEDATNHLRTRLGVVRSLFARLSARSDLV